MNYFVEEFTGNSMDRFQNVQNTTKRPTHQNTNTTIRPAEKPMRFSGCPPLEDNPLTGYGIDCAGKYRELPYIGYIEHGH